MKNSSTFKVGMQNLANYVGRSRVTCQRALQALEEGGLIAVERNNGRKHIVTILEVEERDGQEAPTGSEQNCYSDEFGHLIRRKAGRVFRSMMATPSERSDRWCF